MLRVLYMNSNLSWSRTVLFLHNPLPIPWYHIHSQTSLTLKNPHYIVVLRIVIPALWTHNNNIMAITSVTPFKWFNCTMWSLADVALQISLIADLTACNIDWMMIVRIITVAVYISIVCNSSLSYWHNLGSNKLVFSPSVSFMSTPN